MSSTVYLDINHRYALGDATAGHPGQPPDVDVLRQSANTVEQGQLLLPLSAMRYMELSESPRSALPISIEDHAFPSVR
ncbi:MAG TPA: hypothetical protein VLW50_24430 [Streptosporangiaceae bacterium]|nr:hypothetical protein [Streptosporangiaceae bacterium]